jgi:hypothetical protein
MHRTSLAFSHLFLAAVAVGACGRDSGLVQAGPVISEIPSLILQDSASRDLGPMLSLAVDGHDGVILTDVLRPAVLHFGPDGNLLGSYGREGDGPGELRIAFAAVPFRDSLLAVIDHAHRVASVFDQHSMKWVGQYALPELPYSASNTESGLWLGALNHVEHTSVLWLSPSASAFQSLGPIPGSLEAVPALAGTFPYVAIVPVQDTLILGFQPLSTILIATGGRTVDSLEIPKRLRRGTPSDLAGATASATGLADFAQHFSLLMGLYRLPNGQILALHIDPRPPDSASTASARGRPVLFWSTKYVSVLAADRRAACVDAALPVPPQSPLTATVIGDTLVILEQVVSDTTVVTRLRRFRITTDHCAWRPVH